MWTPPHVNTSNEHSPNAVFFPGLREFRQHFCFQEYTRLFFTVFNFFRIPLPFILVELSTANVQGALYLHRGTKSPGCNNGQSTSEYLHQLSTSSERTPQSPTENGRNLWGSFWVTESLRLPLPPPADAHNLPPTQHSPSPGTEVTPEPPLQTLPSRTAYLGSILTQGFYFQVSFESLILLCVCL